MKRVFNFNPGPATLPVSVLEEASRGVLEIGGSGMSILEVSHRGPEYEAVHFEAQKRMLALMGLSPDQYTVMFLGGGASMQFAMLPMNVLKAGEGADYVHTGEWSSKAIKEAKFFGKPNVVASGEAQKFASLPREMKPTTGAKYLHITTNNTIEGTQFWKMPETGGVPLVADMSSDMLGRKLDFSKFSMIYAGAQKNLGPAGVTAIVMKKSFMESMRDDIPAVLSYKTHDKAQSLYNTPPAYAIYVLGLVLKWVETQGGVAGVETRNQKKAGAIYQALDERLDVYDPAVTAKEDRSHMNITFRLRDSSREKEFLAGAEKLGLMGLKGHRSVGGFRASIYNAFPAEGAEVLAGYIRKF